MPTFKSYLDILLIPYIHILYEIDVPFVLGQKEYDGISFFNKVLRKCGFFFVDEMFYQDNLYKIVIEEYFKILMNNRVIMSY